MDDSVESIYLFSDVAPYRDGGGVHSFSCMAVAV